MLRRQVNALDLHGGSRLRRLMQRCAEINAQFGDHELDDVARRLKRRDLEKPGSRLGHVQHVMILGDQHRWRRVALEQSHVQIAR